MKNEDKRFCVICGLEQKDPTQQFCPNMGCSGGLITYKCTKEKPNIIFGILTNGEIFVEVNGIQHSPDEPFYKLATLQASKLTHQVRDLELQISRLEKTNKDINKNLTDTMLTLGNIKHQIKISKVGY